MKMRNILLSTAAGAMTFAGDFLRIKQNYSQRKVRVNTYKTGGKAFTKGKRSKSLKTRANKLKAKGKK
jgi:hypothetical protein